MIRALGTLACCACLSACASSQATKAEEIQRTVERERSVDKLVTRGKMFMQVGDLQRAAQYFAAALDEGAEPKHVLPLLLRAYVQSSRYRDAIEVGERYLTKNPEDYKLRFLVATLYSAIGETEAARANLEHVLVRHPDHAQAHYAMGVLLRDSENDLVGADYHFRHYLELDPSGPYADEARGSLLKKVP